MARTYKNWASAAEDLHEKIKECPFGGVEMSIELKGAPSFGEDVLTMKINKYDFIILKIGQNEYEATKSSGRQIYFEHKPECEQLLAALTKKVNEKLSMTDTVLYAMVQDQIPKAIIMRMEGKEPINHLDLMKMAIEEELRKMMEKFNKPSTDLINTIQLRQVLETNFLGSKLECTIAFELIDQKRMQLNVFHNIIEASKNRPSICSISHSPRDLVIFLSNLEAIKAVVSRMASYIDMADKV